MNVTEAFCAFFDAEFAKKRGDQNYPQMIIAMAKYARYLDVFSTFYNWLDSRDDTFEDKANMLQQFG